MNDADNKTLIYSENDAALLLGILMNDSTKCLDDKYPLEKSDFEEILFHKIVYVSIYNLAVRGAVTVDEVMINEYLSSYPEYQEIFTNNTGISFCSAMRELTADKINNIQYYWEGIRKHSILRDLERSGIDIKEIWDRSLKNSTNEEELNKWKLKDIISFYDEKQLKIKRKYNVEDDGTTRKKAGESGKEIYLNMKKSPMMGIEFESKYLTTLWNGCGQKQFFLRSGDTSSGKSRSVVGDMGCMSANELFDIEENKWVENPNGGHGVLYIGCEMELDEECDPLMWAYVSGVESSKIIKGECTPEEDERVMRAIDIVSGSKIWLTDMPNFNIKKLEEEIKFHKKEFNIGYVGFDYILLNQALVKEFCENRGSGVGSRGDEVLLELSAALKNMCKEYNIGMISATQVNASISDYKLRDYQVLRGGKAIADKATGGSISMPITEQELNLVRPYIASAPGQRMGFGTMVEPNFVETVYKSRFSEFPKECKIFSYYNLGNMRKQDLFVTDKYFKPINVHPSYIRKPK